MTRCVRALYRLTPAAGIEQTGWISEARLRAWEYHEEPSDKWTFAAGDFSDIVRRWRTSRPDLRVPEELLVGDSETRVVS